MNQQLAASGVARRDSLKLMIAGALPLVWPIESGAAAELWKIATELPSR